MSTDGQNGGWMLPEHTNTHTHAHTKASTFVNTYAERWCGVRKKFETGALYLFALTFDEFNRLRDLIELSCLAVSTTPLYYHTKYMLERAATLISIERHYVYYSQ